MSASVLGKRSRSAADPSCLSTRSKRRIVLNEPNDENQDPFVRNKPDENIGNVVQEKDKETPQETESAVPARVVPAKRNATLQRGQVSPSKINAHYKVTKSDIQVFEDCKSSHIPTPKTPRHRDAVSSKVSITPRHRLFTDAKQVTPRTPKTPYNGSTSIYQQARQLFSRCSSAGRLIARDQERSELSAFISTRLQSKSTGCIYISGPPGTGKSALVQELLQQYEDSGFLKTSVVNCMSIRNTKDLSGKLSDDLDLKEDAGFDYLRSCLIRGKANDRQRYLVVLDEVDRLVDLDLDLLYNLFELSMQASSRLILIGIANALDLTDRFLPRLKSRNLKPELLPFMPYSSTQIAEILTSKLKSLTSEEVETVPFLHPAAIQFCAKKVASQTGDLRKAFDICRRAIDLIEQETREKDAKLLADQSPSKTPLMENINLSSPPTPRSPGKNTVTAYTLQTAPKATIAHVAKVTAQVFSNGTIQRLSSLNLQQKAVLCALSALEKRKRDTQIDRTMFATPSKQNSSAPSIKQLFSAYSQLCKRENLLHPLTAAEFRDVVSGLETLSLVTGVDSKNGSFAAYTTPSKTPGRAGKGAFGSAAVGDDRRFAGAVGRNELSSALEGPGSDLLREILNGDIVV